MEAQAGGDPVGSLKVEDDPAFPATQRGYVLVFAAQGWAARPQLGFRLWRRRVGYRLWRRSVRVWRDSLLAQEVRSSLC